MVVAAFCEPCRRSLWRSNECGGSGVAEVESLGDRIAFEAERLARAVDTAPGSCRVRAFLMRALSLATTYATSTFADRSSWLAEMGVDDLARQLASELNKDPYRVLAEESEVVAASEALFAFWKRVLGELGD